MRRALSILLMFIPGCISFHAFERTPVTKIDSDWTSPLDGDLRVALADFITNCKKKAWPIQIRWAGVRGTSYAVEQNDFGQPVRQSSEAMYAFAYPARGKCYLSPKSHDIQYQTRLARDHLGGGRYGTPYVSSMSPFTGADSLNDSVDEVVCSAIDDAKGGIRVGADGTIAAAPSPVPVEHADGIAGAYAWQNRQQATRTPR